jgi:hypothetical protein
LSRRRSDMTVCIAAICTWPADNTLWIVGASDRMLSAPDIKFEPPQQKIYRFHQSAVALVAGDPYAQASICEETFRVLGLKPVLTVKEVAEVYADAFSAYRRQTAEAMYLKPLGLDANSFMDRSQDLKSELVSDLRASMQHQALDAAAIIAGRDGTGPHLFVVSDPGIVTCADSVAFASIGSGKSHADSYFMLEHHTRNTQFHKALLDTYVAKRRSEVSPTVGTETDLFYIGPTGFRPLEPVVHKNLEDIRSGLDLGIGLAKARAEAEAWEFILDYTKPHPQPQEAPPEPERSAPTPAPPPAVSDQAPVPTAAPRRRKRKAPDGPPTT